MPKAMAVLFKTTFMAITLPLETVVLELTAKAVQGAKPVLIVMGTGQCSFVVFTVCCQPSDS
jgi:hypothetical protein